MGIHAEQHLGGTGRHDAGGAFGDYGTIIGSVIGAIFIGVIGFGLLVMGFSTTIQEIIRGGIIILAVSMNRR